MKNKTININGDRTYFNEVVAKRAGRLSLAGRPKDFLEGMLFALEWVSINPIFECDDCGDIDCDLDQINTLMDIVRKRII